MQSPVDNSARSSPSAKSSIKTNRSERGYQKVARWSGYESFRPRWLLLLLVCNGLLAVANISLVFQAPFGQMMAVLSIVAIILCLVTAVEFSESTKRHFRRDVDVQAALTKARTGQALTESWPAFQHTTEGLLVLVGLGQAIVMVIQFWASIH